MKRYKNLWDEFISIENFELAARRAVKSKKSKKSVQYFLEHKDELIQKLRNSLIDGTFKTSQYKIFTIYEPKQREIYKLPLYPDHILHHALINILGPIWQKMFVRDSYACIPGRGLHAASKRIMDFVRRNEYVLQCDIRKFYPSINHEIMFNIIKRKVGDKKLLRVLHDIIWSCGADSNLPIGNLTSQWMGNVYLNEIDHFIKENLHCRDYIRYCDDFCLFANDKKILHQYKEQIKNFLWEKLKLCYSKSVVFPTWRGVAFIGYRHFKRFVMLRKYGAYKMKKYIMNIITHNDFSEHTTGQLAAYHGWVKWCCGRNFINNIYKKILFPDMRMFVYEKLFVG